MTTPLKMPERTPLTMPETLEQFLDRWRVENEDREAVDREAVASVICGVTATCATISALVAKGPLAGSMGAVVGDNADGDAQKELDVVANDLLVTALRALPVAAIVSEEMDDILKIDAGAPLCVAMDPLDGSSNIDINVSIGTIFSVLPTKTDAASPFDNFLRPGTDILAAGYVVYGPQTTLTLTLGEGTRVFTMDPDAGTFHLTRADVQIDPETREFAINASNAAHWEGGIRRYINDCNKGLQGPRHKTFNMRWVASLVAECQRIITRGGIFLYPADKRAGYSMGRLRLLYEAAPVALLIEQAGGAASNGQVRILDVKPKDIHMRVPLIFGSRDEVAQAERYEDEHYGVGERSPLFGQRGLFRQ